MRKRNYDYPIEHAFIIKKIPIVKLLLEHQSHKHQYYSLINFDSDSDEEVERKSKRARSKVKNKNYRSNKSLLPSISNSKLRAKSEFDSPLGSRHGSDRGGQTLGGGFGGVGGLASYDKREEGTLP